MYIQSVPVSFSTSLIYASSQQLLALIVCKSKADINYHYTYKERPRQVSLQKISWSSHIYIRLAGPNQGIALVVLLNGFGLQKQKCGPFVVDDNLGMTFATTYFSLFFIDFQFVCQFLFFMNDFLCMEIRKIKHACQYLSSLE